MYSEISTVINFAKNHNNRRPHKKKKSETGKRGSEVEGGNEVIKHIIGKNPKNLKILVLALIDSLPYFL